MKEVRQKKYFESPNWQHESIMIEVGVVVIFGGGLSPGRENKGTNILYLHPVDGLPGVFLINYQAVALECAHFTTSVLDLNFLNIFTYLMRSFFFLRYTCLF